MFDVVISGGGPVGLFLACELKLAGIDPVVLEQRPERNQTDKAHGLTGQVVRLLDHRGLVERCGGPCVPEPAPGFYFGALELPLQLLGDANPMYLLPINQRDLEQVFEQRASELGVDVRRGTELRSFMQTENGVDLVLVEEDGAEKQLSARYLLGCDGAHSMIRKQSGIAFPGNTDKRVVDRTALIGPNERIHPMPDGRILVDGFGEIGGNFHRTETGVLTIAAFDPERPLVHTTEWEDHSAGDYPGPGEPMSMVEMEDSIERVLGVRIPLTPPQEDAPRLLRRLCGRNTRLAERYRDGRVFLVGDAAHVHAAAGGPGLNLGLQDAANLAWKIAADIHGWAPDGLLDSYETERRALGQRVFLQTQAQTALMAPGPDVTALRELFAQFLTREDNVRTIAELMAGADVRYDMGESEPALPTGKFAPPLRVVTKDGNQRRLAELHRDGRPLLVDLAGGALADTAAPWNDRVSIVHATADDAPAAALLLRPDGYLAWSGADPNALRAALARWFGAAEISATVQAS